MSACACVVLYVCVFWLPALPFSSSSSIARKSTVSSVSTPHGTKLPLWPAAPPSKELSKTVASIQHSKHPSALRDWWHACARLWLTVKLGNRLRAQKVPVVLLIVMQHLLLLMEGQLLIVVVVVVIVIQQ